MSLVTKAEMSIFKLNKNDVESFSIVTNPLRHYTSSSVNGVTGSLYVFPRRSSIEKESGAISSFIEVQHSDTDVNGTLRSAQYIGKVAQSLHQSSYDRLKFNPAVNHYLNKVNETAESTRKQKVLDIDRFTPSFNFTTNTAKKLLVKDILNKYYRVDYPSAHWAYTNYNSLNFFTASTVPSNSALLYPNVDGGSATQHTYYVTGAYALSGAFSFDFYINPRYNQSVNDGVYNAGTIYHLSSSFAVSLISGSSKDENGKANAFRILLQLSNSAGTAPNRATIGSGLTFASSDNSLLLNRWHHVIIRWGTNLVNDGTGSFNIDGVDKGTFVIPSGTVAQKTSSISQPSVLVIGNYYDGVGDTSQFFATDPATRDGLEVLYPFTGVEQPAGYTFHNQLNAELHDVSIKRYYMADIDIEASASVGPKQIDDRIGFYLPPFFVQSSSFRQFVNDHGGILQTPFFEVDGTTNDPFNVALSFGVGGHYINIENFLRDFAANVFPRVHCMTASAIASTTQARSANDFLYDNPFTRRRNLLIMPCDDGNFVPSYELLVSESNIEKYVDDLGVEEFSFINLDNLISTASLLFGTSFDASTKTDDQANQMTNESIGFTPEQPGIGPGRAFLAHVNRVNQAVSSGTFDPGIQDGAPLPIFQRTRDPSSNQVTFFSISNLFYGKRILPGSLEITDSSITGSSGAMSITLRDDSRGTIYRADSLTSASTWNSVGTIFYDEGLIVIKSPHLYFFGKEQFDISFKGENNVHVMKINALAPANMLNSSSNVNFQPVKPSGFANDPDSEFVYVTGINFHDDNFNVIAKAQLAQPILKRHGDRLMFRIAYDT